MLIRHTRLHMTIQSTVGILAVDGLMYSLTLEDPQRKVKIPGQTAIPPGIYRCGITFSPKLQRKVVQLLDVPGFDRIYAHSGNKPQDTDGCVILASNQLGPDYIQGNSRKLEDGLLEKVIPALSRGEEVWWQVIPASDYL